MAVASCEEVHFAASDGASLFVRKWSPPEGTPTRAILHLHHGLGEHSARYARLAEHLASAAGIATVVHDARGHGHTSGLPGSPGLGCVAAGAEGPALRMVQDLRELLEASAKAHPGVPLLLLGHSFGTVVSQLFVGSGALAEVPLAGLVLSSPPSRIPGFIQPVFKLLLGGLHAAWGEHGLSKIPGKLSFDKFQASLLKAVPEAYKEGNTGFEWLNRDVEEVRKYVEDDYCGHDLSVNFWRHAVAAIAQLGSSQPAVYKGLPAGLPMLIIAGEQDHCAYDDFGNASYRRIQQECGSAGKLPPKVIVYPGARHELLLETNHEEVMDDVTTFLRSCLNKPPMSRL